MKRRRRKHPKKLATAILLQLTMLAILLCGCKALYHYILSNQSNNDKTEISDLHPTEAKEKMEDKLDITHRLEQDNKAEPVDSSKLFVNPINLQKLSSQNAILIRQKDKKVLFEKNSSDQIYPASLTKIMTAIVAIEKLEDLAAPVKLPSEMFDALRQEGASMAGFLPEETVPALDLLYGILLPSGAECSIGLAQYIAGSEADFVTLMNDKAKALDMKNSHFSNCTGLNAIDHYTTVEDMAKLLSYALDNEIFRDIFTSSRHSTASTNQHPGGITLTSTMFDRLTSPLIKGGSILGGKTGYTDEAGLCLASLAEKEGLEYILITTGAEGNHKTEQYNILDALYVYNHLK